MDHEAPIDLPNMAKVTEFIRKMVLKAGYEIPSLFAHGTIGTKLIGFAEMPETFSERAWVITQAGFSLAQEGKVGDLVQVIFFSPIWSVTSDTPSYTVRPSQDPQRKEELMIARYI